MVGGGGCGGGGGVVAWHKVVAVGDLNMVVLLWVVVGMVVLVVVVRSQKNNGLKIRTKQFYYQYNNYVSTHFSPSCLPVQIIIIMCSICIHEYNDRDVY